MVVPLHKRREKRVKKYISLENGPYLLQATLQVPETGSQPYPFVVFLHGYCDDRNEINYVHTELSEKLEKAGIASVRFDFAGCAESSGCFAAMTISQWISDAKAWVKWAQDEPWIDSNRIALHGLSLGGCIAAMTAGELKGQICALSLWCPATDLITNLQEHKLLVGIDLSDIEEKGYADVEGLKAGLSFYEDAMHLHPYETAAFYKGPVTLVHGTTDQTASCQNSVVLKEVYGSNAQLLLVDGADHRFLSTEWRQARMNSAFGFLTSQLLDLE